MVTVYELCTNLNGNAANNIVSIDDVISLRSIMSSQDFSARILDLCTSLNLFSILNPFARSPLQESSRSLRDPWSLRKNSLYLCKPLALRNHWSFCENLFARTNSLVLRNIDPFTSLDVFAILDLFARTSSQEFFIAFTVPDLLANTLGNSLPLRTPWSLLQSLISTQEQRFLTTSQSLVSLQEPVRKNSSLLWSALISLRSVISSLEPLRQNPSTFRDSGYCHRPKWSLCMFSQPNCIAVSQYDQPKWSQCMIMYQPKW